MSKTKPRYIIFGAGAIGCVTAGLLARAGSRVVCVARPPIAEALARGIILRDDKQELTITADAVTRARDLSPQADDIALITAKSQATQSAVEELFERYGGRLPVVCFQNGSRNEEIAARTFDKVYAGLVFFAAAQLEPGLITFPQGRVAAIGTYPSGVDDTARELVADLSRAGFDAIASAHVMAMKWGKLVANLNNATTAITGYYLEQAMADPEMRQLMLAVREEGLRVLEAAGIEVEPPPDEPSPIRIREMTEKLRKPPKEPHVPRGDGGGIRTYSSMWQDLAVGRKTGEADFLNGEIVSVGGKLGIPTPYNATLLEIVTRMFDEGRKPGILTPSELHALMRSRSAEG
ncbi:MAG TPA: ketopantoate reductase family protein [Blastocatellia bacterium]|nr:ketopantoate reductase family protein [Blastocatellia bacterium]